MATAAKAAQTDPTLDRLVSQKQLDTSRGSDIMGDSPRPQTPVVIFDEFLAAEEWRGLLAYTLSRASDFRATQIIGANGQGYMDPHTRRSRVLYDLGPIHKLFVERLMIFLPHVLTRLRAPWFPVAHFEVQLTGTNNGEYFHMHADSGPGEYLSRHLTFVYFFHREPRGFAGGDLRIYDTRVDDGHLVATGPYHVVYPLQNRVVLFPSGCLHEILPVGCPSGDFADSRFTVNGWLHRPRCWLCSAWWLSC
jgi:Rps23 Pro-64 3,4-dihydroxylase Tpa1-like proline 4-hydroxylase